MLELAISEWDAFNRSPHPSVSQDVSPVWFQDLFSVSKTAPMVRATSSSSSMTAGPSDEQLGCALTLRFVTREQMEVCLVAFASEADEKQVQVFALEIANVNSSPRPVIVASAFLPSKSTGRVLDLSFYNDDTLSVLVNESGVQPNQSNCVMSLFDWATVMETRSSVEPELLSRGSPLDRLLFGTEASGEGVLVKLADVAPQRTRGFLNLLARCLAVSGERKVAALVAGRYRVIVLDMDPVDEEENEEEVEPAQQPEEGDNHEDEDEDHEKEN